MCSTIQLIATFPRVFFLIHKALIIIPNINTLDIKENALGNREINGNQVFSLIHKPLIIIPNINTLDIKEIP